MSIGSALESVFGYAPSGGGGSPGTPVPAPPPSGGYLGLSPTDWAGYNQAQHKAAIAAILPALAAFGITALSAPKLVGPGGALLRGLGAGLGAYGQSQQSDLQDKLKFAQEVNQARRQKFEDAIALGNLQNARQRTALDQGVAAARARRYAPNPAGVGMLEQLAPRAQAVGIPIMGAKFFAQMPESEQFDYIKGLTSAIGSRENNQVNANLRAVPYEAAGPALASVLDPLRKTFPMIPPATQLAQMPRDTVQGLIQKYNQAAATRSSSDYAIQRVDKLDPDGQMHVWQIATNKRNPADVQETDLGPVSSLTDTPLHRSVELDRAFVADWRATHPNSGLQWAPDGAGGVTIVPGVGSPGAADQFEKDKAAFFHAHGFNLDGTAIAPGERTAAAPVTAKAAPKSAAGVKKIEAAAMRAAGVRSAAELHTSQIRDYLVKSLGMSDAKAVAWIRQHQAEL